MGKQTARDVARTVLAAFRRDGAWSDGALKHALKTAELDVRDAALATQLCYGVLQNRMLCDFYITQCSSLKLNKIAPGILDILRLGVYQLLFLERIPPHAAVNDAVSAARRNNSRAAGFVNAVLRKVDRDRDLFEVPNDYATRYSHPEWLVSLLKKDYGTETAVEILKANNEIPQITARVNTLKCTTEECLKLVPDTQPHPWLENCIVLHHPGNIDELSAYRNGMIQIQDPASQLAALNSGVKPGMRVLDTCAAPGGKSFVLAQMLENKGELISCDIHVHKLELIRAGAERLGISALDARLQDASEFQPEFEDVFDVVLSDVPCSGLGVIRKKADIRYKAPEDIEKLPELQLKILNNSARYVKTGGTLVYSTCTIRKAENEEVVSAFLKEHPSFELEELVLPEVIGKRGGMITLLPHEFGTDGFFICRMRRTV